MRNAVAWPAIAVGVLVLLGGALPGFAAQTRWWLRDAETGEYRSAYKTYYSYTDTTQDTCYQGQDWCTKTKLGDPPAKLQHSHCVEAFTEKETTDADNYQKHYHGSNILFIDDASTQYNCHSYALYWRFNVWVESPYVACIYDYDDVDGTHQDPYEIGQKCRYYGDHSSIINLLANATGEAKDAAEKVKGKWNAYPVYKSHDHIKYGEPNNVVKKKPGW